MRTLPDVAMRIRIAGIGQIALLSMPERHKLPVVSVTRNDRFWCFGSRLTAVVRSSENIDHLALLGWLLKKLIDEECSEKTIVCKWGLLFWNGVDATLIPWVTADNPFEGEEYPIDDAKSINSLIRILTATRIESAPPFAENHPEDAVIEGEGFLIYPDAEKEGML